MYNILSLSRCDKVIEMTRNAAVKHEPLYPPLCWGDVEKDARVITSSDVRISQPHQVIGLYTL